MLSETIGWKKAYHAAARAEGAGVGAWMRRILRANVHRVRETARDCASK